MIILFLKGKRKSFSFPALLLTLSAFNPLLYNIWDKLNNEANVYWRVFWIIPIIPVCSATISKLVEKTQKTLLSALVLIIGIMTIVLCGKIVYTPAYFNEATNAEKLPNDVVDVGNALLEIDEDPYVISDASLSVYLRQFNGKIKAPYSRNISTSLGMIMSNYLNSGDFSSLSLIMANNEFEYLVTENQSEEKQRQVVDAGFILVRQVRKYGIYKTTKAKTEKRIYNDYHQVISITYVDNDGEASIGERGYSTICYKYDNYGRVVYEFHRDPEGKGVANSLGKAGYYREYNRLGQIIKETNLDENEMPVVIDYATRICKYNHAHQLVQESYYDTNDQLMLRTDLKYASRELEYGDNGKLISESYFDTTGKPAIVGPGYNRVSYEYTQDGTLSLSWFFDTEGNRILCGSSFFHEYLESIHSLQSNNIVVILSIKDEGTNSLTPTLQEDLFALGIQTSLLGKNRNSFCAIITTDETLEKISDSESTCIEREIDGITFSVVSGGFSIGNTSSIVINGKEYSKNVRGMNIVVYDLDTNEVIDSISFDTCAMDMPVTR